MVSSGSPIGVYSMTGGRGGVCVNMSANNPLGNGSVSEATMLLSGSLATATTGRLHFVDWFHLSQSTAWRFQRVVFFCSALAKSSTMDICADRSSWAASRERHFSGTKKAIQTLRACSAVFSNSSSSSSCTIPVAESLDGKVPYQFTTSRRPLDGLRSSYWHSVGSILN